MDEQTVQQIAQQIAPQAIDQAVKQALSEIDTTEVTAEDLEGVLRILEETLRNPEIYPQAVQELNQTGVIDDETMPDQFEPTFVVMMVIVMTRLVEILRQQQQASAPQFAQGGLNKIAKMLQSHGRNGDTMLAHINPQEAAMLKRMGGSGTINPVTGLYEFGFSLSDLNPVKIVKSAGKAISGAVKSIGKAVTSVVSNLGDLAPVIIAIAAPYAIPALAGTLGVSSLAAGMLYGAGSAALTGGNIVQGALLGGLGGGLGSTVGGYANQALGMGLGQVGQAALGGALVGGAAGLATGQGFGKGALMGAAGSSLGQFAQGVGNGAFGAGIGAAGTTAGNMLTVGFSPRQALLGGALSGLATGLTYKPSETAVAEMRDTPSGMGKLNTEFQPGEAAINPETGESYFPAGQTPTAVAQQTPSQQTAAAGQPPGAAQPTGMGDILSMKNLGTLALVSSLGQKRPPEVEEAITSLSPQQQEYFNRPNISWDWNKLQNDANAQNMSLSQYMSTYWPQITSGMYNKIGENAPQVAAQSAPQPTQMAMGGMYAMGGSPLNVVARLARGSGSGRDDTINARLSDGEYVMDAETVAMLGDGSTDAGARKLDEMRSKLRQHKGKVLAKGKFSPNAKSPLAYLKGAA